MFRDRFAESLREVGIALRDPEDFVERWRLGRSPLPWWGWLALGLTAALGTTSYGLTMGILGGPSRMLICAACCTLAAGLAWGLSLPTLYILNSLTGSRLSAGATLLAALVTTSWGGLAMIASIPINWFFSVAIPVPAIVLAVNLAVFTGVGAAMLDVFGRVMQRIEPERGRLPIAWLLLVSAIGGELFYSLGVFQF
jgi:hypothetical protein